MLRVCFVARIVGEHTKSVDIFSRFEPAVNGQTKLADLPSAQNLGTFCYPIGPNNVKPKEYGAPEEFSFTLTGGDGSRTHGFCRTFLPPRTQPSRPHQNTNLRHPQVLCIISKHLWLPFFFKVLQVVEALLKQGDLLTTIAPPSMPVSNPASLFLTDLILKAGPTPVPGKIIRIELPKTGQRISVSPPRRLSTYLGPGNLRNPSLQSSERHIELEVPPDCGNGLENAGVPLAKLLFFLKERPLMTLIEALLLERRILMVATDSDRVSAAVHAAVALIFPFRWQHIYLPLLPHVLQDYLLAPMPFIVGLPAAASCSALRSTPLDEVMLVDLDNGTCTPGSQLPPATPSSLPYAEELATALQAYTAVLRSPTEYESTPAVSALMQSYFLKLLSRYREYIEPDVADSPNSAQHQQTEHHRTESSGRSVAARHSQAGEDDGGYMRADGWRFDHRALVASHRRASTRNFLEAFRHSQMYEVFVTERLQLAASNYVTKDAFEAKIVSRDVANRRSKQIKNLVSVGAKGMSKGVAMLQRAGHSVRTLRHSIGGADEFSLPQPANAGPLASSRLGPAVSLPVSAAAPPSPQQQQQQQQQQQHALAEVPSHAPMPRQPAASLPAPVQASLPEPELSMSPVPASMPIMSGAMAETAAFFSLDDDSGSDSEAAEPGQPSPARRRGTSSSTWHHAHHQSLPLHIESATDGPTTSLHSPSAAQSPLPTPDSATFSLLDFDFGLPTPQYHLDPIAAGSEAFAQEEDARDRAARPQPASSRSSSDSLRPDAQPGPLTDPLALLQRSSLSKLATSQHAPATPQPSSSREFGSPLRPPPGVLPPPLAPGPFARASHQDPLALINPIGDPRASSTQLPMSWQGTNPSRAGSGPLPPSCMAADAPPARRGEVNMARAESAGSVLSETRRSGPSESEPAAASSSRQGSASLAEPQLEASTGMAAAPVLQPASSPDLDARRRPHPQQGTAASSGASSPSAASTGTAFRSSGLRSHASMLDPLGSIDVFGRGPGRGPASTLAGPRPTDSPIADVGRSAVLHHAPGGSLDSRHAVTAGSGSRAARTLTWSDFGMGSLSSPLHLDEPEQAGRHTQQEGLPSLMLAKQIASSGDGMPASTSAHAAALLQQQREPAEAQASTKAARSISRFQQGDRQHQSGQPVVHLDGAFSFAEPFSDGNDRQQSSSGGQARADGDAPVRASLSLLDL